VTTQDPISAAAFLDWTLEQPDEHRHELVLGLVLRARPPTTAEKCVRADLAAALRTALRVANAPCELFADAPLMRVDDQSVYAPDLVVTMGGAVGAAGVATAQPVIVAEALSPVPRSLDALMRVGEFFRTPTVRHVLMADPVRRALFWHHRKPDGEITLRIAREGSVRLDPPGLTVAVADCFVSAGVEARRGAG
jgi:Uma2 family endonuclease